MRSNPTMNFYHANSKGTGSAVTITLHPAHGETCGFLLFEIAKQMSEGRALDGGIRIFPSFAWDEALRFKLDIIDIAELLQVFRGCQESIADGKGLFHRTEDGHKVIKFEHRIEPCPCYALSVWAKPNGEEEAKQYHFHFTPTEAFALMLAVESSMGLLAFGVPAVDTTTNNE